MHDGTACRWIHACDCSGSLRRPQGCCTPTRDDMVSRRMRHTCEGLMSSPAVSNTAPRPPRIDTHTCCRECRERFLQHKRIDAIILGPSVFVPRRCRPPVALPSYHDLQCSEQRRRGSTTQSRHISVSQEANTRPDATDTTDTTDPQEPASEQISEEIAVLTHRTRHNQFWRSQSADGYIIQIHSKNILLRQSMTTKPENVNQPTNDGNPPHFQLAFSPVQHVHYMFMG